MQSVVRKLCLIIEDHPSTSSLSTAAMSQAVASTSTSPGRRRLTSISLAASSATTNPIVEEEQSLPALTLTTTLSILQRTSALTNLTLRLPKTMDLPDSIVDAIAGISTLVKLDLSGRIHLSKLWKLLRSVQSLTELDICGLRVGDDIKDMSEEDLDTSLFGLVTLNMQNCELSSSYFVRFLSACRNTLRSLRLSECSNPTRVAFRQALMAIGAKLRRLELHKLMFLAMPDDAQNLALLNDLPRVCPLLEELSLSTDKLVGENFLWRVLPGLFLSQLDLEYRIPAVSEHNLLNMIRHLPAGRMETLSLGPSMTPLCTERVARACQEIGITVLKSSDPAPPPLTPNPADAAPQPGQAALTLEELELPDLPDLPAGPATLAPLTFAGFGPTFALPPFLDDDDW